MLNEINDVDRMGALAWQLVERECGNGTRDLETHKIKADFNRATIIDTVGHKLDTITSFAGARRSKLRPGVILIALEMNVNIGQR